MIINSIELMVIALIFFVTEFTPQNKIHHYEL